MEKKNDISNIKTNENNLDNGGIKQGDTNLGKRAVYIGHNNSNITVVQGNQIIDNSMKMYNFILADAAFHSCLEYGSSLYERIILSSISNVTTILRNMHGFVMDFRRRKKHVVLYIANVFIDSLYLTNHLVLKIPYGNEYIDNIGCGDFITFDGEINTYSKEYEDNHMAHYGIVNPKIICVKKQTFVELHNRLVEETKDITDRFIKVYPIEDSFRIVLALIKKIQYLTLLYTDLNASAYINIVLTLQFADHLEKFMLVHQDNYNYLKPVSDYLILPLCSVLYFLEIRNVYDPYTIAVFLNQVYNEELMDERRMADLCGVDRCEFKDIRKCLSRSLPKMNCFNTVINDIKIHSHQALIFYNTEHGNREIFRPNEIDPKDEYFDYEE